MQKKKLEATSKEAQQYEFVLSQINKVPDGYKKDDYYGTGYYRQKKDNKFCFYLIYDYKNRNQMKSNVILLDKIEELMVYIQVMEKFAVNKASKAEPITSILSIGSSSRIDVFNE